MVTTCPFLPALEGMMSVRKVMGAVERLWTDASKTLIETYERKVNPACEGLVKLRLHRT